MAVSTTLLSFSTQDQNLWGPGAAIELGINTGDSLIWDPDEITYNFDIGGSFTGIKGQLYLDARFGLYAYAEIGEAGRFGGGIDIAVNVTHDAVAVGGQGITFDFSDWEVTQAKLDSVGFSVGPTAGIDLVAEFQLGIRNVEYNVAFGIGGSADDVTIIGFDATTTLLGVSAGDLELPFDLGYGLELTLRVPSGANTTGTSTGAVVTAEGLSDTRFLELNGDLDELVIEVLKKIPTPVTTSIASALERTIFATYEFDLNTYLPGIAEGLFGVEATVLDIKASVGASISEHTTLDFSNGDGVTPDVTVVLRSDNGTAGDFTDDEPIAIGKLGDANVQLQGPDYDGAGPITVTATYTLGDPRFSHGIGIDLTGSLTIQALTAEVTGTIGELLGVSIGPLLNLEFPEGGFRLAVLEDLYTSSFDVAAGAFDSVTETYEIFYSSTIPAGFDTEKPGAVQELIAYNEARQINIAASNLSFADVIGTRAVAGYSVNNRWFNNTSAAEYATYRFDVNATVNADLQGNQSEATRDVVNIDAFNNSASLPIPDRLVASFYKEGNTFVTYPTSSFLAASNAHSGAGYLFLENLPNVGQVFGGNLGGVAEHTVLTYSYAFRQFRTENSVNILGNVNDDLLVYWGSEAQLLDGGDQEFGSSTGDVLIANFAASHGLDAIEWDLRTAAINQSGAAVDLKLTRGPVLYDLIASNFATKTGYQAVAGVAGAIEIASTDPEATGLLRTGATGLSGTYVVRLRVEDTAYGASTFKVRVVDASNNVIEEVGEFTTNQNPVPGIYGNYSDIVLKDVHLLPTYRIEIFTERGGATGALAESARISRLQIHEQHEVSFLNIESFMLRTSEYDDTIFTSVYRDGITFGAGEDTLFLNADPHAEDMDMGNGADIALIELKGYTEIPWAVNARDRVFGQTGSDEAVVRNLAVVGASWLMRTYGDAQNTSPYYNTGVLNFNSSNLDLNNALAGLANNWHYSLNYLASQSLPITEVGNPFIQIQVIDGGFTRSVQLVDFEAVSFEGSDVGNDLALYFGGSYYHGGDSFVDTFAADFSSYSQPVGREKGISISGFNDFGDPDFFKTRFDIQRTTFTYDSPNIFANGNKVRTSEIKGFERLIVTGTDYNDVLVGGAFADWLAGGDGNDILVGGGSFDTDLTNGFYLGGENRLFGGAGVDTFYSDGSERSLIYGGGQSDLLIFGPGTLEEMGDFGLAIHGLRQRFTFHDNGATSPTDFSAADTAETLEAALVRLVTETVDRGFLFESLGGLGAFTFGAIRTNLTGLDQTDDLFIHDGGATYIGGEQAGDADTFMGFFEGQNIGISWNVEQDVGGKTLANGVYVAGMDRVILRLGTASDMITGSLRDDLIYGNGGSDLLRGGGAIFGDTLYGGQGADVFGWNANDGIVIIDGGSDVGDTLNEVRDRLLVSAVAADGTALMPGQGLGVNLFLAGTPILVGPPITAASTDGEISTIFGALDNTLYQTRIYSGANYVSIDNVESVDVQGSDENDDLVVYRNGGFYDGGDRLGDADVFLADFGTETADLRIEARSGDDRLAAEFVLADIGNGVTVGNFERLFVETGSGDDVLTGGDFGDVLGGGSGNDIVDGGAGSDILDGGAGQDLLFYSAGEDVIYGGADSDILEMGNVPGGFAQIEGYNGSGGLLFSASVDDINSAASARTVLRGLYSNLAAVERTVVFGGEAGNGVAYEQIERVILSAEDSRDILLSGSGGGILSGDGGDDVLVGLAGNDLFVGGAGHDRYAVRDAWGQDVIGGEYDGTGEIHFFGWTRSQITFSLAAPGTDDLLMTSTSGQTLLFMDYFANGANGLNYTFGFGDQTATLDLSGLGAVSSGATTVGEVFFGTQDRDEIFDGTDGADSYFAREGNDLIAGSLGPDLISGGLGTDAVIYQGMIVANSSAVGVTINLATGFGLGGDAQGDILISIEDVLGTDARDHLTGSERVNALAGGLGNDTIFGGAGDDFLSGDAGNDSLTGDADNDTILGGSGNDSLYGGNEQDYLSGGAGNDLLFGGLGNDTAAGGDGLDNVTLGGGNDIYMIRTTDSGLVADAGNDSVVGGLGLDTIELSNFHASVTISLGGPADQAQTVFSNGANGTNPPGVSVQIGRLSGFENAIGSDFDDVILGNSAANQIGGVEGNDLLVGYAGADTLYGGAGFDRLDYSSESGNRAVQVDLALGTAVDTHGDTDTINTIEHIVGSNQVTIGRRGDDLFGDVGNNTFTGNKGLDVDLMDGRAGIDTVDYSAEADTQNYLLNGNPAPGGFGVVVDLSLTGSLAAPNATDTSGHGDWLVSIENVIGSIRGDSIVGGAGDNLIVGGDGADTLYGGSGGFDTLDFGAEIGTQGIVYAEDDQSFNRDTFGKIDTLYGFDRIIGTQYADVLYIFGSTEREIVTGDGDDFVQILGGGSDVDNSRIFGGNGNDVMYGSEGADFFFGGSGTNYAEGGGGSDTYMSMGGNDTFVGGAGDNILNFELLNGAAIAELISTFAYTTDEPSAFGSVQRQIVQHSGVTVLKGSRFGDLLGGNSDANFVDGGKGDDTIYGETGSDTLYGGAGFDMLDYSGGLVGTGVRIDLTLATSNATDGYGTVETVRDFEVFVTTAYDDWLKGDAKSQTFLMQGGFDTVDGGGGFDIADFSALGQRITYTITYDLVTGTINASVLTGGTALTQLSGIEHFIGSNGDYDDFFGGDGNETFTGNAGTEVDNIYGGGGIDTVDYSRETGTGAVTVDLRVLGATNATDTFGNGDDLRDIENVIGTLRSDTITGGLAENALFGLDGDDVFAGMQGDDTIYGGAGIDSMTYAPEAGTGAINAVSGHEDAWIVSDSYGNVDRLYDVENLTGGALADIISGTAADNVLNGGSAGADTMDGRGGNDTLIGGNGSDLLFGFFGNDSLVGGNGVDTLWGEAGDDTLRGGTGADEMYGGLGIDIASWEASSAGVSVTLIEGTAIGAGGDAQGDGLAEIEGLSGSSFNDSLTGDDFDNVLIGGGGADTLTGGRGDDVYETDGNDVLVEGVGEGRDLVKSSASFTLAANFEDGVLTGSAGINLTGNSVANALFGNDGRNRLNGGSGSDTMDGGLGNDTMSGGAGNDTFVFSTALGAGNVDTITEFSVINDTIRLDDAIFVGLASGSLADSAFAANLTGTATDELDRIIYETDTGRLYFDADGSGAGARVHFATLSANLALTNADFFVF